MQSVTIQQEAQLLQIDCAMLRVTVYFAKSLKIILKMTLKIILKMTLE